MTHSQRTDNPQINKFINISKLLLVNKLFINKLLPIKFYQETNNHHQQIIDLLSTNYYW
jgi:hypothetical protein